MKRLFSISGLLAVACVLLTQATLAMDQKSRAASASSYLERGNAWVAKGEYQRAIEDFSLGLAFAPSSADLYYSRGVARVRAGNLAGNLAENLDAAEADFSRALQIEPGMTQAWVDRGYVLHLKGDYAGVLRDTGRALELDPKLAEAHHNRGMAYEALNDLEAARAAYDTALKLKPKIAEIWNSRGAVRYRQQDYAGALADYSQAIKLNQRLANAWLGRGLARLRLGQRAAAEKDFAESSRLDPKTRPALEQLLKQIQN